MKKSKPTPQDKQDKQIAELNALFKKSGTYGDVPIFRDNYDTIITSVLPRTLPDHEGDAEGQPEPRGRKDSTA